MMWLPEHGVGAVVLTNGDPGWMIRIRADLDRSFDLAMALRFGEAQRAAFGARGSTTLLKRHTAGGALRRHAAAT